MGIDTKEVKAESVDPASANASNDEAPELSPDFSPDEPADKGDVTSESEMLGAEGGMRGLRIGSESSARRSEPKHQIAIKS